MDHRGTFLFKINAPVSKLRHAAYAQEYKLLLQNHSGVTILLYL